MTKWGRFVRAWIWTSLGLVVLGASAQASAAAAGTVSVTDLRTATQKQARRDSSFSALYFLADRTVKPDAVGQLRDALGRHLSAPGDLEVALRELVVVDFFPHRLGAGPAGGVSNLITRNLMDAKTDWSFVQEMHLPVDRDSVVCLASGTMNGAAVKAAAHVPYQLKGFAVMVHSNKGFRGAVSECFDQLAMQLLAAPKPLASDCDYDRNPSIASIPLPPAPPPTHIAVPSMAYTAHYRPCLPPAAMSAGHFGDVLLSFHVDASGNVLEVQVKSSSGYAELDASALDAAKHWKFVPAEREGVAYASWQDIPVSFPKP